MCGIKVEAAHHNFRKTIYVGKILAMPCLRGRLLRHRFLVVTGNTNVSTGQDTGSYAMIISEAVCG